MPYIKQDHRVHFEYAIEQITCRTADPGDLNYVISRLILSFIERMGGNYTAHNAAIGVLECAKLEVYRRHTAPYEDKAIERNGDII